MMCARCGTVKGGFQLLAPLLCAAAAILRDTTMRLPKATIPRFSVDAFSEMPKVAIPEIPGIASSRKLLIISIPGNCSRAAVLRTLAAAASGKVLASSITGSRLSRFFRLGRKGGCLR